MGQWRASSNVPRSAGELDVRFSPVAGWVVVPRSCVVQPVALSLNHADPIDLDPDDVACLQERTRLHGGTDAGRRTREDKVARLKCHGLREELDLLPKAVDLLAGSCDWQFRSQQWSLSKSFDTHAPFGPWIVTADEIEDPHSLSMKTYVNGELRQSANTGQQIYSLWEQIELLSQAVTLEAGDLVFTGTPAGVGAAMKPRTFLKAGDVVRVEIDRIGMIEAQCDRLNDARPRNYHPSCDRGKP